MEKEEGERIHREDEAGNGMEKEKEKEKARRHTPPEARDANYSGSCEQFVDYPGNVYISNVENSCRDVFLAVNQRVMHKEGTEVPLHPLLNSDIASDLSRARGCV
ncbi:hypothetical protein ALC60_00562 [Trachymyrmex zeteki]|uniref:Uncharacterized protein n=1 Tax=Mycetomoellerius zeteki TaxID=64791 RepID=A0A151XIC9_9HYME|nr:hypothetical protein ALC60_00562 [Trachymyrmex zeteki]